MNSGGEVLFGRDHELRTLVERLDNVGSGGRTIALVGPPGSGKSALQAAAVDQALRRGFTVLTAQGSEAETHLAYASLHQLLRPLLVRVDRLPSRQREALLAGFGMNEVVEGDPFLTALAVLELVADAAARAPVLISVDDLHWMDQPSLEALMFLARRISIEQVVMLWSARPHLLRMADDRAVEWIEIGGIDTASSVALLDARAPDLSTVLRARVLREADGNPLALLEFPAAVRSGQFGWTEFGDHLPMTTRLERAFASRGNHPDAGVRAVLIVAAVDDSNDFNEVLAAAAIVAGAPVDRASAQPALELGLLSSDGATFKIRHPLVGSALRQAASATGRRRAHAALAQVLADQPERAAWHRAASVVEPDEQIAGELEQAAGIAQRRGAIVSAVTWLERAAALSPDPSVGAARLISAAELAFQLGRYGQVEEIKARVAQVVLRPRDQSRLAWLEGVFHDGSTGEPAEVRRLAVLAEDALHAQDLDLAVQLLVSAGRQVWWRDPGADLRHDIVLLAQRAALPDGDPRLLVVYAVTQSHELGPFVIEQLAQWPPDAHGRPDAAGLLGVAAFCTGDFASAVAFLSTPVEMLRTQGRLSLLAEALAIRAWAAIYLGAFDLARSADEAIRLADETGQTVWAATARIAIAFLDAVHGTPSSDVSLLAEAENVAFRTPVASSSLLAGVQLARGVAALGASRYEEAYDHLRRVFDPADPAFHRVQQVWTLSYLAEAAVHTGREVEARGLLAAMEAVTGNSPSPGAVIILEYSRAVLANDSSAEALLTGAITGAGGELQWHRARAELAYGSWLRRRRRVVESRMHLRTARDAFDGLSANAWAQRADQELRATGERGWQRKANARERLSPQEAQIAQLAAQGLSNREIAQQLYLSHRTVSSHLYRIFPKLGITSRSQLGPALTTAPDTTAPTPSALI
ncbi:MAG: BREX system ATP-binding domain-containing protein [Nakamurella sp.]